MASAAWSAWPSISSGMAGSGLLPYFGSFPMVCVHPLRPRRLSLGIAFVGTQCPELGSGRTVRSSEKNHVRAVP